MCRNRINDGLYLCHSQAMNKTCGEIMLYLIFSVPIKGVKALD